MKNSPLIFVVDDEAENVAVALRSLRAFRTQGFTDATRALAAAIEAKPDVVLVDYRMPDLDGVALVRRLREAGITAGVLMVTAFPEADEVVFAMQTELVYRIIAKPLQPTVVRKLVRMVLREAEFERALPYLEQFSQLLNVAKNRPSSLASRRPSRLAPEGRVRFRAERGAREAVLRDISLGGVSVEGMEHFALHSVQNIEAVHLAGKDYRLDASARVIWIRPHSASDPSQSAIGLRFEPNSVAWEEIAAIMRQAYVCCLASLPEGQE